MLFSGVSAGFPFESLSSKLDWDLEWSGLTHQFCKNKQKFAHHNCEKQMFSSFGSEWIMIQEPAQFHLIDFLKMRILKKIISLQFKLSKSWHFKAIRIFMVKMVLINRNPIEIKEIWFRTNTVFLMISAPPLISAFSFFWKTNN